MNLSASLHRAAYPLSIFRQGNFALVWSSTTLVATGTQMEAVVLAWYILTVTDSPFLVGLIAAARMALNLLALFAGAVVDRLPRHRLLAAVEFLMAVLGMLMLFLIWRDLLEIWHIFAITLTAGMIRIFQMPAAQSLVAETLPADRIGNGAALNTVGMNIAVIIGPLMGGLLYRSFGPQGAYVAIATFFWLSGFAALAIRIARSGPARRRDSVFSTVWEGLRYVKGQQVLWATLLVAVIINLTGWPFHTTLMPIYARNELGTDSAGLGLLLFGFGVGALSGSVCWSLVRNARHVGKLLIASVIAWHATMLIFSLSDQFYLSLGILFFTGASFASTQVLMLTVLLRMVQPEYRGRVLGLRVLAIYAFTFGSMGVGGMAGIWGAPLTAVSIGAGGIVLTLLLALFTPKLLRA